MCRNFAVRIIAGTFWQAVQGRRSPHFISSLQLNAFNNAPLWFLNQIFHKSLCWRCLVCKCPPRWYMCASIEQKWSNTDSSSAASVFYLNRFVSEHILSLIKTSGFFARLISCMLLNFEEWDDLTAFTNQTTAKTLLLFLLRRCAVLYNTSHESSTTMIFIQFDV